MNDRLTVCDYAKIGAVYLVLWASAMLWRFGARQIGGRSAEDDS